ncbi:MAG: ferredoxin [Acidimicrobiales bacterium]
MADLNDRWPDNAPGKFYVDGGCIVCSQCAETAPANFRTSDAGTHSIVYKQPAAADELALCVDALENCPKEAIGDDAA